jgi:glycolate oxidase FAD binding subunit
MKNVTGYDLVRLLTGSWGTLGILTEVSLKVLPKPESAACIMIDGLDESQAIAAMAKAMRSPFEVSGAAHLSNGMGDGPVTMLRIEGFSESVRYRAEQLAALFADMGTRIESDADSVADHWVHIRDVAPFHGTEGDVWRVSGAPTEGADLARRSGAEAVMYDWGGGLIWMSLPEGTDLRARLGDFDGHATLVRGSGQPRFQPELAELAALSHGLRQRFDPKGILNAGLMG